MVTKIIAPKLGLGTEPLTIVEWRAEEGGCVEKDTVILLVETSKVIYEIEAEASGFLHILVEVEQEAPIGSVAGLITETKEELETIQKEASKEESTHLEPEKISEISSMKPAIVKASGERIIISPVARKLAEEYKIDIGLITGTGPAGRIVKKDVEREIETKSNEPVSSGDVLEASSTEEILFSRTGRIIADRLTLSSQTIPHFYLYKDVDMTDALEKRKNYNRTTQTKISVNEMIMIATAASLTKFPRLNAHVAKDRLTLHKNINLGLAVSTDDGVIVPVIPNVDRKDIPEIIALTREAIENAQKGVLKNPGVGTFTISNLSMYLINSVLPIINPPECAILGVGRIERRAVPVKNDIIIRNIMTLTLAADHRAVDGVYGSGFLKAIQKYLEKFPLKPGLFMK